MGRFQRTMTGPETTEAAPAGSGRARRAFAILLPAILLALAAVRLHRSPWFASNLAVVPDTVEYAVGAQRFATLGHYDLVIDGVAYPPHSSPWFSVLFLSPAYFLAPNELGAGIVVVFLFSLAGVLAAFAIGRRLAGDFGGAAAGVALACNGTYRTYSREIMTDVPAVAIGLLAAWLFLGILERERPLRTWVQAGILCAAAQAMRSESLALLLPFAWIAIRGREKLLARLAALGAPCAVVAIATAVYHQATFGDWRRTGYQFWTPVPWDYPELLFSTEYLVANLKTLAAPWVLPWIVAGALGTIVLAIRRSEKPGPTLLFLMLAGVLPSLAHLLFFYPRDRFHLLPIAFACVLGGAGVVAIVPAAIRRRAWLAAAAIPLALVLLPRRPESPPVRRLVADALAAETPQDAVIVSNIDPVCLEPTVVRGTSRRIVPMSRKVEYASKAVAWKRIPRVDPPPAGPTDHRSPGLFAGGARDVCSFTADEDPARLSRMVRDGVPVFVEIGSAPAGTSLLRVVPDDLTIVPHPSHPWLGRLRLRE